MTVAKMDNVPKVAAPIEGTKPKAAVKSVAPAPVVEDEGEEPVVRKEEKKTNAVPAKKANLADMVDDWDAE